LFAGTLFGLYEFVNGKWHKIDLPVEEEHVVDIDTVKDGYAILMRSEVLLTSDFKNFEVKYLKSEKNYNNKVGLFKTLWLIHSGEIWGNTGILLVDLVGVIFIFLSVTGVIIFFRPRLIRRKDKNNEVVIKSKNISLWSLRWHNKAGWVSALFLLITSITGMFLRPPLLIPVANVQVSKIPYTLLDTPNQWYDKLRRIKYDEHRECYYLATIDGIFKFKDLDSEPEFISIQPPVSMMGINVFEYENVDFLLVGSFNGLYRWNLNTYEYKNMIKQVSKQSKRKGFLSDNRVTGFLRNYKNEFLFVDYNSGIKNLDNEKFVVAMPDKIKNLPISLWNAALEFHTGRIYEGVLGGLYILVVPVSGFISVFLVVSGFWVWFKKYRH